VPNPPFVEKVSNPLLCLPSLYQQREKPNRPEKPVQILKSPNIPNNQFFQLSAENQRIPIPVKEEPVKS
jgi:hypothetical protein